MAKYISKGTTIKVGATLIGQLTGIDGLEVSADTLETTTLEDTWREFDAGLADGGEVSLEGFFGADQVGQVAMRTKIGTSDTFTIDFPSALGGQWIFSGVVTKFSIGAKLGEIIPFSASIKVSGEPVMAFTASSNLTALSLTGTGGTLSPAFAGSNYNYTFSGVTATSVTVTATLSGASLKLYVDDVYVQDLTSGSASSSIALTLNVGKNIKILSQETGKTVKTYEVIAVKTA
jgi:hypothetical protein